MRVHLSGLWRYPVKSLGGEPLAACDLTEDGVPGDRRVHVRGSRGPLTARTRYGLVSIGASTGPDGEPLVDGHPWRSTAAREIVCAAAGPEAELVGWDGPERFDILPLLVATDGAVARFGHDVRRLRPNLLVAGVTADAEATWPGAALQVGGPDGALIGVHAVRPRCVVTSLDPDTGAQDLDVFRRIRDEFGNQLALDCWVIRPGRVALDDVVEVVATDAQPARLGGWIVGAPYLA